MPIPRTMATPSPCAWRLLLLLLPPPPPSLLLLLLLLHAHSTQPLPVPQNALLNVVHMLLVQELGA